MFKIACKLRCGLDKEYLQSMKLGGRVNCQCGGQCSTWLGDWDWSRRFRRAVALAYTPRANAAGFVSSIKHDAFLGVVKVKNGTISIILQSEEAGWGGSMRNRGVSYRAHAGFSSSHLTWRALKKYLARERSHKFRKENELACQTAGANFRSACTLASRCVKSCHGLWVVL